MNDKQAVVAKRLLLIVYRLFDIFYCRTVELGATETKPLAASLV